MFIIEINQSRLDVHILSQISVTLNVTADSDDCITATECKRFQSYVE